MAFYEYKCVNNTCEEKDNVKVISMSIKDYSEEKLPKCEVCGEQTVRNYTTFAHQTFSDGYKG